MMRVKLVGANRASYRGAAKIVQFGMEVDVDDDLGTHLLEQKAYSKSMGERSLWQLVRSTEGDSAATLDDSDEFEEEVDEDAETEAEIDAEAEADSETEEEAPPPPAAKVAAKKVAPKKAAPKKARARRKTAA